MAAIDKIAAIFLIKQYMQTQPSFDFFVRALESG